jgi:hypothetical protein
MKTQKITLSTLERIKLLELLPAEGNFKTLRILHEVKVKKIGFKSEELEKLEFKVIGNNTHWNEVPETEIEFTNAEVEYLAATLRSRSEKGTLPMEAVTLYEKIIGEE